MEQTIEDVIERIQALEDELRLMGMNPLITVGNGRQRSLGEIALDLTETRRLLEALLAKQSCSGLCRCHYY